MAAGSETFMALGLLDESSKGVSGTPRMLVLIASVLEKSLQKNEKLIENISNEYSSTRGAAILALLLPIYTSTSSFNGRIPVFLPLNAHRLLITGVMVAAKFLDDECYDNAYYARIGGVSTAEMNRMEMKFLFSLDFSLYVTTEVFMNCCLKLENEGGKYHADPRLWPRRRPGKTKMRGIMLP
uniref:Cyclin n=1 Tax=Salix viminalis TaxID=40686 RepID=A0A6N2M892_SALVM